MNVIKSIKGFTKHSKLNSQQENICTLKIIPRNLIIILRHELFLKKGKETIKYTRKCERQELKE